MSTQTSYFTDGEAYERQMGRWSRAVGEIFVDWLAVAPGQRWLDVGCGTGVFSELVLDRCAPQSISGIDPSADQIAFARTKPVAERADFRVGDARALPFADGEFDVAAMALVISFITEPEKAIAEMKRVVRPGGIVGTYMWSPGGSPPQKIRDAIEAMGKPAPPPPGYRNAEMDNLKALFGEAGLADVSARAIEIEVCYPDFRDFWGAQTALGNSSGQQIRKMSTAEIERLTEYLRAHLPHDRAGRIAYSARANAVKGRVRD